MNIAIIPAKSKSIRIKNKNIKKFRGKPVIYWSIQAAKKSKLFDRIIISTDDKKIINLAKKYSVEAPFLRPKRLSNNFIGILPVVKHAIKKLSVNQNINICCIFAAAPLIKIKNLKKSFKIFNQNKKNFVFPATKNESHLVRSFFFKKKKIYMLNKSLYKKRSQDLKDTFCDAGQFYWGSKNNWLKSKNMFDGNAKILEISKNESIDINTPQDWKKALKIFKKKN